MAAELIVLTCASGKQCSNLIPLLYSNPSYRLRLVVNSKSSLDRLSQAYPKAEVMQADLAQPDDCIRMVSDATALLHIGPPFHPHEATLGFNAIDAAVQESKKPSTSFKHFIFSSVIDTQLRKMLNHERKLQVEEYLIESGLPYTILQPTHLMDPYLGAMLAQRDKERPVFRAFWDPSVLFSFLALKDLAEATAKVITERERHFYAQYALSSTGALSYNEVVKIVGDAVGKEFATEKLSFPEAIDSTLMLVYRSKDVDVRLRDAVQRMLLFYNRRGPVGNPNVLEWLLGRKATTHRDLVLAKTKGV